MSQITTGIRSILSSPFVYETFQNIMGAKKGRSLLVTEYIRPFEGMHILDIGCGTGEITKFLPKNIIYHGYDISREYIDHAKKNFGKNAVFNCKLLDANEISGLPKFDLVMGLGVLHHLNDSEVVDFMKLAKLAMKPGGRILTRDPCYAKDQNSLARLLVSWDRGQHVRRLEQYRELVSGVFSEVNGRVTHQSWIPYTHWTMECRA